MAWYINADQLAEHIAGLAAGMKFEQFPYLSVEVLQNLEDMVRKEPNLFHWTACISVTATAASGSSCVIRNVRAVRETET